MAFACAAITRYMALIIAGAALAALAFPPCGLWIETAWITPLLAAIMFGMGLALKASDFKPVITRPRDVLLGTVAQFTLMPAAAFALAEIFGLDEAAAVGVVLVGACPGGTASNVIAFLAGGDVALSVAMTVVNTLLAPVLTPLIVYFILRESVDVDCAAMMFSILQVVIAPVACGFAFKKICPEKLFGKIAAILPAVAVAAIALIVACVVSRSAGGILSGGLAVCAVVVLHNAAGLAGGWAVAKLFKMDLPKAKSFSIEIGMQNSALAASLAQSAFPALAGAAVPAAIFSVWHNISGGIVAWIYKKRKAQ